MNLAFDLKTPTLNDKEKILHAKALAKASNFKKSHVDLLEVIAEVDKLRLFEKFLLTSTFAYCTQILKLSEDVTYTLIKISRVSVKVPELKAAIDDGTLSISNAKRIAQVLTPENKTTWIEKAKEFSQRKLELEVAKVFPKEAAQEKIKYVSEDRVKLEVGLSEEVMKLIQKAQDLISQKSKSSVTIEVVLKKVLSEYIERKDPVEKAKKIENRRLKRESQNFEKRRETLKSEVKPRLAPSLLPVSRRGAQRPQPITKRTSIPAEVIHKINLRDKQKCQARMLNGNICGNSRWLDYHHKIPVKNGGADSFENLVTLFAQHHRQLHRAGHI